MRLSVHEPVCIFWLVRRIAAAGFIGCHIAERKSSRQPFEGGKNHVTDIGDSGYVEMPVDEMVDKMGSDLRPERKTVIQKRKWKAEKQRKIFGAS